MIKGQVKGITEDYIPILQAHEFRKKTVPLGIILPS